ncbi:MAG: efflux RND transporter permease subunit [Gammaproteobacteria bacterium]|nr:efflux RND transporter permease subunit [Gammaproteobacteria bacterium]
MIAWFADNDVAANLLMFLILALGLYSLNVRIPLEVFPAFELEMVSIQVPFPGATPAEVEEGITIKIEEAINSLPGIKTIRSSAGENLGSVTVEVENGYDPKDLMNDIKARVDSINTFPADAERPVVYVPEMRRDVITLVVSGDLSERELRLAAEHARDDLLALPEITQVDLDGVRNYEISIEVSDQTLRQYGLTLGEVAGAVRSGSLDLAAGRVRTAGGEVLLRTQGQARAGIEFEDIAVRTDGQSRLTIADLGKVRDGFSEDPLESRFNGRPAVFIDIYRVGSQNAIDVADAVKRYADRAEDTLPAGVHVDYWRDQSKVVKARINTLVRNALQGSVLVLLLLTLFLRGSVAFWVLMGMPVAFMGGIALMPLMGVTLNLLSLFAFILVLGIVVDDAIVTGENIFTRLQKGENPRDAAIKGTQEIAVPVTFGVLTTVVAFIPLLMVEGVRGKLFAQIPMIVIPVLLFSLIESKLILPAHLKHVRVRNLKDSEHALPVRIQRRVSRWLDAVTRGAYEPALRWVLQNRSLAMSGFIAVAILLFSLAISGHLRFIFFPRVQSEVAQASLVMPPGTPFEVTEAAAKRIAGVAESMREDYIDPVLNESIIRDMTVNIGSQRGGGAQSHVARVSFEILAPEERTMDITSSELVREWRQRIGQIPGAKELNFRAEIGHTGLPIDVQLSGPSFDDLRAVSLRVRELLNTYPGVFDITDSFDSGKEEIKLQLKPEAELLGLTLEDMARQVRQAFFGFEVQRIQRGRDEVRVYVRYPENERRNLQTLENMRIRTPTGAEVPFSEVAQATYGRGFAEIRRVDLARTINITADVNKETANLEAIKADLSTQIALIQKTYPRVGYSLEGEAREQRDSFRSLGIGLLFTLFAIFALLAIPFRSYLQPLIVMSVIPFGVAGAMLGHLIMGMDLTIMSIMGMLALSGVVVNDSLVLVDYINQRRAENMPLRQAVYDAGLARLRPVLLTSLTTFAGLMPLILEKSTQAQFLIPMAVSLGFGILFATVITLLMIPINYLMLEDLRSYLGRLFGRVPATATESSAR